MRLMPLNSRKMSEIQEIAENCGGNESIGLRNGERYCSLIIPDFNSDLASCIHKGRRTIRDIGVGHEKYAQIYLCNKKRP